jgi:predicted dipeptidase
MVLSAILLAATLQTNVASVTAIYERDYAKQLVPLLSEILHFSTTQFDAEAHAAQKAWLAKTAHDLGFTYRDAGLIDEIELPGPPNAPVLGLMAHGDVQPVEMDEWFFSPFSGKSDETFVYGRGSADDKGPLVQALLAMKALKESGVKRTHTIRLLAGSREESEADEMPEYLKTHAAPDYSLVLDSEFPVVVGEKAWNALTVTTALAGRAGAAEQLFEVADLSAGLGASIVPDHAEVTLRWKSGTPGWEPIMASIRRVILPEGTRLVLQAHEDELRVVAYGHSAHAGVNIEGGRNALVALALAMEDMLPPGGANDLLAFARVAGEDLYGTGLGFTQSDPLWGRYAVNVATIKPDADDPNKRTLTINIRSTPPRTGAQLEQYLKNFVSEFNQKRGASLTPGGWYLDAPLAFDPRAKLVLRLLEDYDLATGTAQRPAISGGGTYAKRLPSSIAFGMWFPGKPYPGHDVDEKIEIADLQKGAKVLIYALTDIATGRRIKEPFKP